MDELNDFRKVLNNIRDGEPEEQDIEVQSVKRINKVPFENKKSRKPVLKMPPPKWSSEPVKPKSDSLWNENKEFALFSLLASAVLSIVGIIVSVNYLIIVGSIGFLLTILAMFFVAVKHMRGGVKSALPDNDLQKKINELSQKIELMEAKDYSANGFSLSDERVQEMEGKIEELRTIVKTLMKSAGNTRG